MNKLKIIFIVILILIMFPVTSVAQNKHKALLIRLDSLKKSMVLYLYLNNKIGEMCQNFDSFEKNQIENIKKGFELLADYSKKEIEINPLSDSYQKALNEFIKECDELFPDISNKLSPQPDGSSPIFKPISKPTSKAIIVAGTKGPRDYLRDVTSSLTNFAYRSLIYRGFSKEAIYYLSPNDHLDLDEDGKPDVYADATNENLKKAIEKCASDTDDFILYFIGYGEKNSFYINGSERLYASDLNFWLNQLQSGISGKLIVIYDACYSGSFLPILSQGSNKKQITITSASTDGLAWFIVRGTISFSSYFWSHIFNGLNIKDAFDLTKESINIGRGLNPYVYQSPFIDDNGDGQYDDNKDGFLAQETYIGTSVYSSIKRTTSKQKAIIVVGDIQSDGIWSASDEKWSVMKRIANFAYNTLSFQGYSNNNIYFIAPEGFQDNSISPTLANLKDAINIWATENTQDLVLYMIGKGDEKIFYINEREYLSSTQLDEWLDNLQTKLNGIVTFVYDANRSATFFPSLLPPEGKQRILISSTNENEAANFLSGGDSSFSKCFWMNVLLNEGRMKDAMYASKASISRLMSDKQTPQLDDDGNGIGNKGQDGELSKDYIIGKGLQSVSDSPIENWPPK